MPLSTNIDIFQNELMDEIKLFYPDFNERDDINVLHSFNQAFASGASMNVKIQINDRHFFYDYCGDASDRRGVKIFNKLCMYKALSEYTDRQMPWGSLTGIRPTKLAYDMLFGGARIEDIPSLLMSEYMVSKEKSLIVGEIINNQSFIKYAHNDILFYVHIPFCKSICSYCAFTAEPVARSSDLIKQYTLSLINEIKHAKRLISELGLNISAAYIGGGTPTSIDDQSFEAILSALDFKDVEFTCEAGRPDTITIEKLRLMSKYGINRLCVNPQTLHDKTLRTIGRSHTLSDFLHSYAMAKKTSMDINVDLIAGLPDERFEDFRYSLQGVMELSPQNITVHTLSIKNGAQLKVNPHSHSQNQVPTSTLSTADATATVSNLSKLSTADATATASNLSKLSTADASATVTNLSTLSTADSSATASNLTKLSTADATVITTNPSTLSTADSSVSAMTDFAYKSLMQAGYKPYYLYRQKQMTENLENIGYAKAGKQCAYNIASMEEALPVMANGAGGISKMLYKGGRIERLANLRDIRLYIAQSDSRLTKKSDFFNP